MYSLDLLIIHANLLQRDKVVEELYIFMMEITFLQVSIQRVLLELIENPLNSINMIRFIDVDHDII